MSHFYTARRFDEIKCGFIDPAFAKVKPQKGRHAIPDYLVRWASHCWNGYTVGHRSLQWRHNERYSVSNHQPHDGLLNHEFRRRSKKTSKLRVTGLCAGNSPGTGEFPAQMASYAENVSIWWRHHVDNDLSITIHWIVVHKSTNIWQHERKNRIKDIMCCAPAPDIHFHPTT